VIVTRIVGIDLGTTNSGVAIVQNGAPVMLPNGSERIIPSVVGYSATGQWLVGTPARNQYVLEPDNTVRSIKRKMGSDALVTMGGQQFTPQQISAFILRELKNISECNLGSEISDVVITVPAYFTDAARQATHDAGRIAGFNVRRIINEPTAAALAYGLNQAEDQIVLVYDLGGGTFDVSLVELMGGVVEVRASHGNTQLGGDDFDHLLAEDIAIWFNGLYGIDLRNDRRAWARLLRAAENAKIQLSVHPYITIKEEYIAEKKGVPLHLEYEVSRKDFESLIHPLLNQTLDSVRQVLKDAAVAADAIHQVLLVGGSTYIPAVWELLREELDIEPQMSINPEEAVALGAGVQAAIIAGEPIEAILVDVTPHSLGIAVAETFMGQIIPDNFKTLIRRNTTIPTGREEEFYTVYPDQDTIRIEVYQGEKPIASQNTALGNFIITGLEPERAGELARITVQFDFDVNGILKVIARDRKTGKQETISVDASHARMSEAEILAARDWVEESAAALEGIVIPEESVILLAHAHELLASDTLKAESRQALGSLLVRIESAQAAGETENLEDLLDTLEDLLFDLEDDEES
jgi:molecular chaperone DnaK